MPQPTLPATVVQSPSQSAAFNVAPTVFQTVAGQATQTFRVNVDPHFRDLADCWRQHNATGVSSGSAMMIPRELEAKRTSFFPDVEMREAHVEQKPGEGGNIRLTAVINTSEIDRYQTIIEPRGGDFENYRKNPVLLWAHGSIQRLE